MADENFVDRFRFGQFELQPRERRLLVDGEPVAVGARAFDLLLALVARAGLLVPKDDLLSAAWRGLVVEESNLQVQVSALRKILGAGTIETVAGHGYRFTTNVEPISDTLRADSGPARHNLPRPLTSFVGHADDLIEYGKLLEHARLLTLTGIGGCGKTRLAIQLAESIASRYSDVWFIDLAPLQESERLASTVARTLGIFETRNVAPIDALIVHMRNARALVVLDNCEHVLEACASFARSLLEGTPNVHVLATSREGLGVMGERMVAVRSLSLPRMNEPLVIAGRFSAESTQLFVERAQLVDRDFVCDATSGRVIADICRRLDGVPLAVELAAARTNVLSVEQIRERLNDRFRLLVNRGKATPRHQTLQAVLQWSYDHLSPDEQRLFGLCSVFVGGWTLDAAMVVCNPEVDGASLVDLLDGLVKKSLVSVDRGRSTGPRYRMLEIVRQFSHDQQLQSVEADSVRHRHLAYYLALAESIDQSYSGQTNDYFFPRLDQERENIVAAHAWCSHGDNGGELGLRLVNAMRGYWLERKYLLSLPIAEHDPVVEGHRLIVEALRHHGARARTAHRCRALFAASQMSYLLRKFEQANSYLDESLAIARELNDTERMSARLRVRSYYFRLNGDVLRARQCMEEGLALAEQHGPPSELAMNLSAMGNLMLAEKRISEAEQCFVRALELGRKVGRPALIASIAVELCVTALQRHDTATALRMLRDAHPIVERLNEWEAAIQLLEACAALAVHRGDWVRAARFFGATKERIADMILDDPGMVTFIAELLARSEQALGAERFAAEVSLGSGMSYQDAIRETGDWLMQQCA